MPSEEDAEPRTVLNIFYGLTNKGINVSTTKER